MRSDLRELLTDQGELVEDKVDGPTVTLAIDGDARVLDLENIARVEVELPQFFDGRAYSNARVLRERGYSGLIVITGDVRVDHLGMMARVGIDRFRLAEGADLEVARRVLRRVQEPVFYQPPLSAARMA